MDYLPIFVRLHGKHCVVVGGGDVAARKVATLLAAGAHTVVVAPELGEACAALAARGGIGHVARRFTAADVDGATLVIAATDDPATNAEVSASATAHGIPVNVVDSPQLCSFIMPAIIERAPVLIAVSTGGASPVLARLIRTRLEALIPTAYGRLAQVAAQYRDAVKARLAHPNARRAFWEEVLGGAAAELLFEGNETAAHALIRAKLREDRGEQGPREVYFICTGPGAADLLTCRALRLMQQADTVVFDPDVPAPIVAMARRDASCIDLGARASQAESPGALVARLAQAGGRVARLRQRPFGVAASADAEDPEIAAVRQAAVPFTVVPGLTPT